MLALRIGGSILLQTNLANCSGELAMSSMYSKDKPKAGKGKGIQLKEGVYVAARSLAMEGLAKLGAHQFVFIILPTTARNGPVQSFKKRSSSSLVHTTAMASSQIDFDLRSMPSLIYSHCANISTELADYRLLESNTPTKRDWENCCGHQHDITMHLRIEI